MKHDHCSHPSTAKDRAACRKARQLSNRMAMEVGLVPGKEKLTDPKTEEGILEFVPADQKATLQRARDKMARRASRKAPEGRDALNAAANHGAPMADLLPAFERFLRIGWEVRFDGTDKVRVKASKGEITFVWGELNGEQARAFWFRPWDTSVSRKVANLGVAISLGEGN